LSSVEEAVALDKQFLFGEILIVSFLSGSSSKMGLARLFRSLQRCL
jgi:hypothetical protein